MSFSDDIQKWTKKTGGTLEKVITATCIDLSSKIIQRTPVDTGRARGNWLASLNSPISYALPGSLDKSGAESLSKATAEAAGAAGNVFYLMNNLPYIQVLEYGKYPNPPQKGTGKTSGGFSTQAPQGMTRITVLEFEAALSKAVAGVNL